MCEKFPIGTKLRSIDDSNYGPLVQGQIYTVTGYNAIGAYNGPAYLLAELPNQNSGFFGYRFKQVVDESFNVSTATDQELADEYRRVNDERKLLHDEIIKRGYVIKNIKYSATIPFPVPSDMLSITKTTSVNL